MYVGNNFVFGLVGVKDCTQLVAELEATCKNSSSKPVKTNVKADVKFDFKIKGKKPVVTKEVCQFNITGADFNEEAVLAVLAKHGFVPLD